MAEGFKLLFLFSMVACLASGTAALESFYRLTSSGPCEVNSCGEGSTWQSCANETLVCLCFAGHWYNNASKGCDRGAKVFPGQLTLPEIQYEAQMNNTLSEEFLNGSNKIINLLKDVFNGSVGYLRSTVLKLEENNPQSRFWSRAGSGVIATVDIIFDPTAATTTEEVEEKIQNATCAGCPLEGANFISVDLCKNDSRYPCDPTTTESCSSVDGSYNCSCKDGYVHTNNSDSICIAENTTSTPSPTSTPPGPCEENSCGEGSTCQPLAETFVCLCLAGDWFNNASKSCEKAKVFPGQLILPEIQYEAQMNDTLSEEFLNGSNKIINLLKDVFNGSDGYLGSTVLKLEENNPHSRFWSRVGSGVIATVDIIFDPTAATTTEEVEEKIQNATCTGCPLEGANFISVDLCKNDSRYPCDPTTTESCSSVDGSYNCSCKDGYVHTNNSDSICIAENTTSTPSPTSTPPGPCEINLCGEGSTCEPRANETFVCLCLAGDWYNSIRKSCEKAKVFPGQLILPGIQYEAQMSDTLSEEFLNGSNKIINLLKDVFNGSDGYLGSTVLKLEENNPHSRFWSRAGSGVNATVDIIFDPTAATTTEEVEEKIQNATCAGCPLEGANFINENLCEKNSRYPCEETTTTCSSEDGSYYCSCKDGYLKTNFSDRMCIGCPSGQKVKGSQCIDCPFGYTGFNCKDNWQLILIIVGSVLGGLLLITLILLPIVACISSKRSSKKNKNKGNPGYSQSAAEALLAKRGLANSKIAAVNGSYNDISDAGVPKMPRAMTPSRNITNLEMTQRNSQQNQNPVGRNSQMYGDEDDAALYAQTLDGPHNNPYAQRPPQINPHALRQGQSNPSYIHDDGRRFNY